MIEDSNLPLGIALRSKRSTEPRDQALRDPRALSFIPAYLAAYRLGPAAGNIDRVKGIVALMVRAGAQKLIGHQSSSAEIDQAYQEVFKSCMREREKIDSETKQVLADLDDYRDSASPLAVSPGIIQSAKAELAQAPFRATSQFPASGLLVRESARRKVIYDQIVVLAKQKAVDQVVEMKDVQLTKNQEAGLVRNLVFILVTRGLATPLISSDDLTKDREVYTGIPPAERTERLKTELQRLGVNVEENLGYLRNLDAQVEHLLNIVPPLRREDVERASDPYEMIHTERSRFYLLYRESFLVDHPLGTLPDLSLNPREPNTIWQPPYASTLIANGQAYRVIDPGALRILARKKQITDPSDMKRLEKGASAISRLQEGVRYVALSQAQRVSAATEIAQGHLDRVVAAIGLFSSGSISRVSLPQKGLYFTPSSVLRNSAEGQLENIDRLLAAMDMVQGTKERALADSLHLLGHLAHFPDQVIPHYDQIRLLSGDRKFVIRNIRSILLRDIIGRLRSLEQLGLIDYTEDAVRDKGFSPAQNAFEKAQIATTYDIYEAKHNQIVTAIRSGIEVVKTSNDKDRFAATLASEQELIGLRIKERIRHAVRLRPFQSSADREDYVEEEFARNPYGYFQRSPRPDYLRTAQATVTTRQRALATGVLPIVIFRPDFDAVDVGRATRVALRLSSTKEDQPIILYQPDYLPGEGRERVRGLAGLRLLARAIAYFKADALYQGPIPTLDQLVHLQPPFDAVMGKTIDVKDRLYGDRDRLSDLSKSAQGIFKGFGLELPPDFLPNLLTPDILASALFFAPLMKYYECLEGQIRDHFGNLRQRLLDQLRQPTPHYLSRSPNLAISTAYNAYMREMIRAQSIIKGDQAMINARLRRASQSGFIKPESEFKEDES